LDSPTPDSAIVVDSSAVLAVILKEPGSEHVAPLMRGALISSVNLAEVHTRLQLRGSDADFAWNGILELECQICPFDAKQALIAGELIQKTRSHGLSLGDRACLALAIERKAAVYTADGVWKKLSLGIVIETIR
jgi:ribonuclease VapC